MYKLFSNKMGYYRMSPDAQAMNGSVVSSVTDKFGFMCGEGDETDQRTEQGREENAASSSLHTDLEILRYHLPASILMESS
jgi:hypothetical protein